MHIPASGTHYETLGNVSIEIRRAGRGVEFTAYCNRGLYGGNPERFKRYVRPNKSIEVYQKALDRLIAKAEAQTALILLRNQVYSLVEQSRSTPNFESDVDATQRENVYDFMTEQDCKFWIGWLSHRGGEVPAISTHGPAIVSAA